jgi:hypothetical protein
MPLTKPGSYHDKTIGWTTFFHRQRVRELAPLVDAALLAEHQRDPRGGEIPHSHALKQILDFIHNQPTDGKSFAYAATPYADYQLGIMHQRGTAPTIFDSPHYTTEREAVHAVFVERLRALGLLSASSSDGRPT